MLSQIEDTDGVCFFFTGQYAREFSQPCRCYGDALLCDEGGIRDSFVVALVVQIVLRLQSFRTENNGQIDAQIGALRRGILQGKVTGR